MDLPFRCLILDHDDTAVNSTVLIHHPSHVESMRRLRPGAQAIDLEGWFLKNFDPGIMHYLVEELGLSKEELDVEYGIWRDFNTSRIPPFFPGFLEYLRAYRERGGIITVVSHSEKDVIHNAYRSANGGEHFLPDMVFGWDYEESRRKPSPWPVRQILERFDLRPDEAVIVDDLKPGVLMSRATGVRIAAAGWAHGIAPIRTYMRSNCDFYLESVEQFGRFILGERIEMEQAAPSAARIAARILAGILFLFGVFAFFGSLFMWGEGFLLSFPEGVDYRFPVTDILVNTPASIIAAIGLWRLKRFGYIASQFVAGFYIYASVEIFVEVIQAGPPYPLEIVVPQVLAVAVAAALVLYLWRIQAQFR